MPAATTTAVTTRVVTLASDYLYRAVEVVVRLRELFGQVWSGELGYDDVVDLIVGNRLLANLVFVALVIVGMLVARWAVRVVVSLLVRLVTVRLLITDKDEPAFTWMIRFLGSRRMRHCRDFTVATFRKGRRTVRAPSLAPVMLDLAASDDDEESDDAESIEDAEVKVSIVPLAGQYRVFWRHRPLWVKIRRVSGGSASDYRDEVELSMFGFNPLPLRDLVNEAHRMALISDRQKTIVYRSVMGEWRRLAARRLRSFDSVVLRKGLAEELLGDVEKFRERRQWYQQRGIPYRRGYLFWGPPGCGKTSFIQALAGKLHCNICVLSFSDSSMNDSMLSQLLNTLPSNALVLLEDVDAVFVHEKSSDDNESRVTFSGLLNAIDGVGAQEGSMLFMTTNHLDRLSEALIRPGRVDKKALFDYAERDQLVRLFLQFYPGDEKLADEFAATVIESGSRVTLAQVQGHFLCYQDDALQCVRNVWDLVPDHPRRRVSSAPMPRGVPDHEITTKHLTGSALGSRTASSHALAHSQLGSNTSPAPSPTASGPSSNSSTAAGVAISIAAPNGTSTASAANGSGNGSIQQPSHVRAPPPLSGGGGGGGGGGGAPRTSGMVGSAPLPVSASHQRITSPGRVPAHLVNPGPLQYAQQPAAQLGSGLGALDTASSVSLSSSSSLSAPVGEPTASPRSAQFQQ